MGKPQRITKLAVPWSSMPAVTAKNSVIGATVIGDYLTHDGSLDPEYQTTRWLVFERPEPVAKPQGARRKHRKAQQANENEVAAVAQQRDLSKERA